MKCLLLLLFIYQISKSNIPIVAKIILPDDPDRLSFDQGRIASTTMIAVTIMPKNGNNKVTFDEKVIVMKESCLKDNHSFYSI